MSNRRSLIALLVVCSLVGCARHKYRWRADRDSYGILHQKTKAAPWAPEHFSIDVDPASRLYDSSPVDDPWLPRPAPHLYAYELPDVQPRDPRRFMPTESGDEVTPNPLELDLPRLGRRHMRRLPEGRKVSTTADVQLVTHTRAPAGSTVWVAAAQDDGGLPGELPEPDDDAGFADELGAAGVVPIEIMAWESIPANCLARTFEFPSIVKEYERSFGRPPGEAMYDSSQKLALEDLLELALLNSREYQTQKENLYRASLRVSLERFAYQIKFSPTGNGVDADWFHRRDFGVTEDTLAIPSGLSIERIMATGGTFFAQFANEVILTFNGPTGFAADIGSDVFAEFTQTLLQRDIVFEDLTQAERDVIYAARDFARFRKQLFRDIASDYYDLLLNYRTIEINMLDFFSNRRGFQQAKYEYELRETVPLFQVDQFEQQSLSSRSSVIGSCNSLEQSLDELKLRIGIPPETPINLDLNELDAITARDEIIVAAEMASRSYRNLSSERANENEEKIKVVNAAIRLAQRLLAQLDLESRQLADPESNRETRDLTVEVLNKLRVEDTALTVLEERGELERELQDPRPPGSSKLFYLRMNTVKALLELGRRQLQAYEQNPFDTEQLKGLAARSEGLTERLGEVTRLLVDATGIEEKNQLLAETSALADEAGRLLDEVAEEIRIDERLDAGQLVERVVRLGDDLRSEGYAGLSPIDLDDEDAMLTALVTRFDLMNERGELADTWRQIKLAGDDPAKHLESAGESSSPHAARCESSLRFYLRREPYPGLHLV